MRIRSHRYRLAAASVAVVLVLSLPVAVSATPSTPEIEAKQEELAAAKSELDRLADDLSMMVEEYNAISEALDGTRAEIATAEHDLGLARQDEAEAGDILADRATQIYKDGGSTTIQVLLGTRSFEDFLVRLEWLRRLSSQDARVLAQVRDARRRVASLKRTLEAREAEQVALRDEAASQRLRIENAVARQEAYADSLDTDIQRLIAEEEERQRRLAEERAREAAEAARLAAEAASAVAGEFPDQDPAAGDGRPEVVSIALEYLGVPYVWGGSSPAGFDCSGLVQYVYARIGVTLPRTSRSQFRAGSHISPSALDQLVMGDLVFFGYDGDPERVHHVGIYCGSGNFIHAPSTGEVVQVSSLAARIAAKGDYVGASRF